MCTVGIHTAANCLYLTKWTPQSVAWDSARHSIQRVQAEQGELQFGEMTYMYTISLFVGSEEGVGDWGLDDFNLAALCIWCAGQSVVCIQRNLMLHHNDHLCHMYNSSCSYIQRNLMLHHNDRLRYTYNSSCSYAIFCVCSAVHRVTLT